MPTAKAAPKDLPIFMGNGLKRQPPFVNVRRAQSFTFGAPQVAQAVENTGTSATGGAGSRCVSSPYELPVLLDGTAGNRTKIKCEAREPSSKRAGERLATRRLSPSKTVYIA